MLEERGLVVNRPGAGREVARRSEPSQFDAEMLFGRSIISHARRPLRFAIFPGELEHFGDVWRQVLDDFERKSRGVTVETVPTGSMNELQAGLRKAEIDVFQIPLGWLPVMIESALILRPEGGLDLDGKSFLAPVYEATCRDGGPWGVPLAVSCCCMFFNGKWEIACVRRH